MVSSLASPNAKPTVWLIKNAFGAGVTLEHLHGQNIRGWWEGGSDLGLLNIDTHSQRVGRSCGYGKHQEDYPIYGDLSVLQKHIDIFERYPTVNIGDKPEDVSAKATHVARKKSKWEMVRKIFLTFTPGCSVTDPEKYPQGQRGYNPTLYGIKNFERNYVSTNNKIDYADFLYRTLKFGHAFKPSQKRIISIDGPNLNFQTSWELLEKEFPQYVKKHIEWVEIGEIEIHGEQLQLDDGCVLSEKFVPKSENNNDEEEIKS